MAPTWRWESRASVAGGDKFWGMKVPHPRCTPAQAGARPEIVPRPLDGRYWGRDRPHTLRRREYIEMGPGLGRGDIVGGTDLGGASPKLSREAVRVASLGPTRLPEQARPALSSDQVHTNPLADEWGRLVSVVISPPKVEVGLCGEGGSVEMDGDRVVPRRHKPSR